MCYLAAVILRYSLHNTSCQIKLFIKKQENWAAVICKLNRGCKQ